MSTQPLDPNLISANVCRPTLRGIGDTPPGESWCPLWILSRRLEFSWDEQPDFLFFGDIGEGEQFLYPSNTIRIFLTGENIPPNWDETDYALTHERVWNERHWRLPLWRHWYDEGRTQVMRDFDHIRGRVNRFCNFIYSNDRASERIEFFHELSRYKQVDAGGKVLNNIGGRVDDKREFVAKSKFTIAFENESHPGYATEKIIEPLLMGSIPIYWGDPEIESDFNPDCFVNAHRFSSWEEVADEVQRIDSDDDLWEKYVTAPIFRNNQIPERLSDDAIAKFCQRVFDNKQAYVPKSTKTRQRLGCVLRRKLNPLQRASKRATGVVSSGIRRVAKETYSRLSR